MIDCIAAEISSLNVIIGIFLGGIPLAYYLFVVRKRLSFLAGIPVAPNNSILFGWTLFSDNAFGIKRQLEDLGPIIQGRALNRNVLVVRDAVLAKQILRDVRGKGFFHNPSPKLIRESTFSLDTGPEVSFVLQIFIND